MDYPLISIVIVNWNGEGIIEECLESLSKVKYPKVEIIVVDNGSTDSSLKWLRLQPHIKLLENKKNEGFAKGTNIGFSFAKGKYVVALNNDMIVEPSWLNEAVYFLEKDKNIGIIASRQMNYYKRDVIDVLYHVIAKDLTFYPYGRDEKYATLQGAENRGYVISASGGSAIYRKEMLQQIGYFDENFFAYCEDSDLSMRAFLAGWKCLYLPTAIVYHKGSLSFSKIPEKVYYYGHRNRYLLIYKYFPLSLIVRQLPWLLTSEIRVFLKICMEQKLYRMYFSIVKGIFEEYKKYKLSRKKNMGLLKQKRKDFLFLLKHGIKMEGR